MIYKFPLQKKKQKETKNHSRIVFIYIHFQSPAPARRESSPVVDKSYKSYNSIHGE